MRAAAIPATPMPSATHSTGARGLRASRRARARLIVFAGIVLWWLNGCTTVIVPPADPADPVSVFVLDHGRHSSLVLPLDDGGAVRYSYGDWDYYVLNRTSVLNGLRALLWPSPAALGRQLLAGPPEAAAIRRQLRVEVVTAHEIRVAADDARRLQHKLAELFASAAHTLYYDGLLDIHFVHHPEPYTLTHNSNYMVKRWLEQLGCEVSGRPILSNWQLRARAGAAAAHDL